MSKPVLAFLFIDATIAGGAERTTFNIINHLSRKGHNVAVISLFTSNEETFFPLDKGITFYRIMEKPSTRYFFFPIEKYLKDYFPVVIRLRRLLKEIKPSVVFSVAMNPSIYYEVASIGLGIKEIVCEHGDLDNTINHDPLSKWARILGVKYGHGVVLLTEENRNKYNAYFKSKIKRSWVIPNAIPIAAETGNTLDQPMAIAIGRFVPEKGFERMVNIWASVLQAKPTWKLKIIGDGPLKESVRQIIRDKQLEDHILIEPATHEIEKHYRNASIFVMTSHFEGLPMVLLEAMEYGMPIVAFDCPSGPRQIIKDNEDGFLIENNNNNQFVAKIITLIEDDTLRKQMGKKAKYNIQRFSANQIVPLWENLIKSTLDE